MPVFAVSEVQQADGPIDPIEPRRAVEMLAGGPVEAWSEPGWPLVAALGSRMRANNKTRRIDHESVAYHPFVAAVHAAFDKHYPLELSPDAVWLCIAQGFATHVVCNAEALRARFVRHSGRALLSVRRDDFVKGRASNPWPEVFSDFSGQIAAQAGEFHGAIVPQFSTTDATAKAAFEVALLSAAQPYFKLEVASACGIPQITLTGTLDDWRSLRQRAAALERFEAPWVKHLLPVLDRFCDAFDKNIDLDFWRSLYKFKNASGGPYYTGWINTLLPYTLSEGKPVLNFASGDWAKGLASRMGGGPTAECLPSGLSRAPFLWKHLASEYRMEFLGGFTGVGQDPKTLALRPEIGWAVRQASR